MDKTIELLDNFEDELEEDEDEIEKYLELKD